VCPVAIAYADPDDAWIDDMPFVPHFMQRFAKSRIGVGLSFGRCVRARDVPDLRDYAHTWIGSALRSGVPGPDEREFPCAAAVPADALGEP
jgi:hypothetical protein